MTKVGGIMGRDARRMLEWLDIKRVGYPYEVCTSIYNPTSSGIDPEKYGSLCRAPFLCFGSAIWLFAQEKMRDEFAKEYEASIVPDRSEELRGQS